MSLEVVARLLDGAGVRYALIGAVALAARGASRSTVDLDLLTVESRVLSDDFWRTATEEGLAVEVRKGDVDDPLRGVVRIKGAEPVDVVVAKYRWQSDVVDRAEPVQVRGVTIRIPTTTDLVLLKLFAGGSRDLGDIRNVFALGDRQQLLSRVDAVIESLPDDMRDRWAKLRPELA